eukprot:TRINITY_DN91093_c0_g1_i1.p1 TRINITY_DN91093_c0_g1~~TRINITY_DN91093_c0_g1_i1.p1  ORF type:complete len:383 (-),score=50.67 TRINITY_DN91093_c0_g1_i1:150-1268(-)
MFETLFSAVRNRTLATSRRAVAVRSVFTSSQRFSTRLEARETRVAAKRSLDHVPGLKSLEDHLGQLGVPAVLRRAPTLVQVNIGLTCNLSCSHCHVESSPARVETLSEEDADRLLELLAATPSVKALDITGGAPEMHRTFKRLVKGARGLGLRVIDRCNLTILMKPLYEWVEPFLAEQGVDIIASMPCYSPANVNAQRGDGVFDQSIEALQRLNARGYGISGSGLSLDLVYNPGGAFLPPDQKSLEEAYKRELKKTFGIEFNSLFCITNMPIKRFAGDLRKEGKLGEYMELLVSNFNVENLDSIMCRDTVHVGYDGTISDCDFNFALNRPWRLGPDDAAVSIRDLNSFSNMNGEPIHLGKHCWGCVAGAGSS